MDIKIPKKFDSPKDPRPFYRFVSEKALALIKLSSFSAVELCPGPNFHPMSFFSEAAGDRLSSYTAVELVPGTYKFLESNKRSGKIRVLNKDIRDELREIRSGSRSYDVLLLSGLIRRNLERILKSVSRKIPYILIYLQNARSISSLLKGYDLVYFSFPGKKPSVVFASLK